MKNSILLKALPLGGWLCEVGFDGGWSSVFYIFGLVGIVWSGLMMLLNADTPQTHKFISVTERDYILDSIGDFSAHKNASITTEVFFVIK
jgi:hypothetical protein